MMDWGVMDFLILAVKCAVVFVLSAAGFDVVHYILHRWEKSRFALLRWLGDLHAVHHDFLDREMQIQRNYSTQNLIMHVIPEYMTAVIGIILFGFVLGWLPSLIVLAIRTVMVIVYVWQKGEDITHKSMKRINGNRSLFFVGPHYHALHHVFVNQYYSSFFNVFDLVFGTNCQIMERNFLVMGADTVHTSSFVEALKNRGGRVDTVRPVDAQSEPLNKKLHQADVVVLITSDDGVRSQVIERFIDLGRERLLPPEVWDVNSGPSGELVKKYYSSQDVTYRKIRPTQFLTPKAAVRVSLFFITRGFYTVPML